MGIVGPEDSSVCGGLDGSAAFLVTQLG